MKIKVLTEGKSISVDMEKESADIAFKRIAGILLGTEERYVKRKEEFERKVETPTSESEDKSEKEYRGFLIMKCEKCGQEKAFCTKGISEYTCTCGHVTPIKELKPLFVNCQCGNSYKYLTNMEEPVFDVKCMECGNPVAVKYNEKKMVYQTIRQGE